MNNISIDPKDAKLYVISYNTLRIAVGILGILLPILLVIGVFILDNQPQPLNSISSYGHTKMGNGFVGIMCAVSLFMFSYLGHDFKDNLLGHLAGIFALGIAFFPNNVQDPLTTINIIHLSSALCFFTVLILFSLWLFPKTNQEVMSAEKKNRNRVYKICGYTMIVCIAFIIIYMALLINTFPNHGIFQPVFWLESFALLAFGISWITKGQVIYKDKKP
ncbi:MAG: hypothetical protein JEY96_11195 [Bacteroidales bacterium]|nr:hypothetical protein [Bacteroidales bacterium]